MTGTPKSKEFTGNLDKTPIDANDSSRVTGYAIIDVIVGPVPEDEQVASANPMSVRAMIDTGATTSAVDKGPCQESWTSKSRPGKRYRDGGQGCLANPISRSSRTGRSRPLLG